MRPNPQETADLLIFTEEILNGKLRFLCSVDQTLAVKLVVKYLQSLLSEVYLGHPQHQMLWGSSIYLSHLI